jgi:hypothetical protein
VPDQPLTVADVLRAINGLDTRQRHRLALALLDRPHLLGGHHVILPRDALALLERLLSEGCERTRELTRALLTASNAAYRRGKGARDKRDKADRRNQAIAELHAAGTADPVDVYVHLRVHHKELLQVGKNGRLVSQASVMKSFADWQKKRRRA